MFASRFTHNTPVLATRRKHLESYSFNRILFARLLLAALLAFGALAGPARQGVQAASSILRVTPGGGASATCGEASDWSNPCSLQTALAKARSSSAISELWLQEGVYKPSTNNRSDSFDIRSGLHVFGGFAGYETSRSQRTFTPQDGNITDDRLTILTGDINTAGNAADNSYHVVSISDGAAAVVLDRLVIADGNADGSSSASYGAGLYVDNARLYLSDSKVVNNQAKQDGGGLYAVNNSTVDIVYSQILSNTAGSNGGGVFARDSHITILNTIFYDNSSSGGDGAYAGVNGSLTIANTIFWQNPGDGAAIDIQSRSGQQTSSVDVSYSVVEGGCPSGVTCPSSVVTTPASPLLNVGSPITLGSTTFPNITIPSNSSFFNYASDLLIPGDPYDLNGDGVTGIYPYDINGGNIRPTAVWLSDFRASADVAGILLEWETAAEIDNIGFNLYRTPAGSLIPQLVNPALIPSLAPGSLMGASYTLVDTQADPDGYYDYVLEAIDVNGTSQFTHIRYGKAAPALAQHSLVFLPLLVR